MLYEIERFKYYVDSLNFTQKHLNNNQHFISLRKFSKRFFHEFC